MTAGVSERARGALLGLAVGDALGGPLERLSPAQIRARHDGPVREMVGGGWLSLQPGQGTDDTAMALALARAAATATGYDPLRALAGYLEWYATDPPDIGETTRAALAAGPDPGNVAAAVRAYERPPGRSGGNGSLMRTAPLALRYLRDPEQRAMAARTDSELTHRDAQAADACAWLCEVLATLIDGRNPATALTPPPRLAAAWATSVEDAEAAAWSSRAGLVDTTVAVAAAALRNAASFEERLVWAVNLGGDADTNGAVAGALLGAHLGETAIPERWLTPLLAGPEMARLAESLVELAS